jgi:hypothetical protein
MATEVLRGTIEWRAHKGGDLHSMSQNQIRKKVFKINGLDKYRIPRISKQSIILPTYSRISF